MTDFSVHFHICAIFTHIKHLNMSLMGKQYDTEYMLDVATQLGSHFLPINPWACLYNWIWYKSLKPSQPAKC